MNQYEEINHPLHYAPLANNGIECIDIAEMFNFNIGQVIKYVWRAGKKPDQEILKDLKKAEWYLKREIRRVEEQINDEIQ